MLFDFAPDDIDEWIAVFVFRIPHPLHVVTSIWRWRV
jgi:hypothetical protein